jgi:hypothetical protein
MAASDPNFSVELEARLAEARSVLLSANSTDLSHSYRFQLEKAVVLCYQASQFQPDSPLVWLRLGRLAEIRSLWAEDPQSQEDLLEEARAHFLRAARLGYDQAHASPPPVTPPLNDPADPFVAELIWAGRLRRGEIDSAELTRRYAFNDLNPLFQPELWANRRYILLAIKDPLARSQEFSLFQKEFDQVWGAMPTLVPNPRPDPPTLRKIDVLLAYTETVLALAEPGANPPVATPSPIGASDPNDPSAPAPQASTTASAPTAPAPNPGGANVKTQNPKDVDNPPPLMTPAHYFREALALYGRAFSLPLDPRDQERLLTSLKRAEYLAPDPGLREALWALRDQLFNFRLKTQGRDPALWAALGEDYYGRAEVQADDRLWAVNRTEAAKKFQKFLEFSPQKDRAHRHWGQVLEAKARLLAPGPGAVELGDRAARYSQSLTQAQEQYQKAWDLGQNIDDLQSLARVTALLAFEAKTFPEFLALFQKAVNFSHLAVRSAENPARAWLAWTEVCLAFTKRSLPLEYTERVVAEIFASYNHFLSAGSLAIPELIEIADGIWAIAAQYPAGQDQALSLITDICRRLKRLAPLEPGYGFALGLTVYAELANRPAWPDDPAVTSDLAAKRAFNEVLSSFLEGLEGLSLWRPSMDLAPPAGTGQAYEPLRFLAPEVGQAWVYAPLATFQERLASALNRPVSRLLAMAQPQTLPPWYQLKLASFLRLAAATGYPPEEEQMAYWRLALDLLRQAESKEPAGLDLGLILAEEGLVLAELNLLNPTPDPALLKEALSLWDQAEKLAPGSSHYARARWAAWRGDLAEMKKSLAHPPALEDNFTWPSFREAISDPAFRAYREEPWLKAAWFGYSR